MNKMHKIMLQAGIAAMVIGIASGASASVVYKVDNAVGVGSIVGSVTTDGSFGVLTAGNFTAWNLKVTGVGGISDILTNLNSGVFSGGTKTTANAQNIYFDFTHDNANPSYLLFQKNFGSGNSYACAANAAFALTPCFEGSSAIPEGFDSPSAAYGNPTGLEIIASAAVPEPASWALMISGFGLVGSAMRRRTVARVTYA